MKKTIRTATLVLAGLLSFPALGETDRPHILLILADDLGYADLSVQRHSVPDTEY